MLVAEDRGSTAYSTGKRSPGSNIILNGTPVPLLELGERKVFAFLTKYPDGDFERYQNTMHYRVTEDLFQRVRTEMQHAHQLPPMPSRKDDAPPKDSGTQIALQNLEKRFNRKTRSHTPSEKKLEIIKWIRSNPNGKYADMQAQLDVPTMTIGNFYNLRSQYLHSTRVQSKIPNQKKEPAPMSSTSNEKKTPYHLDPRIAPETLPLLYNLPTVKPLDALRSLTFEGYKKMFPDHKDVPQTAFYGWKGKEIKRRGAKSNTEVGFELNGKTGSVTKKHVQARAAYGSKKKTGQELRFVAEKPVLAPVGSVFYSIPCVNMASETKLELKRIIPEIMETLHPDGGPFKCLEVLDVEPVLQIQKV